MGRLITLLLTVIAVGAFAQEPTPNQTFRERYYKFSKYMAADSGLILPQRNTSWTPFRPALTFNPSDNQLYLYNGTSWNTVSGGGGGSQTLQQVTDLGNVSSNALIVTGQGGSSLPNGAALFYDSGIGAVYLANISSGGYVSGMGFSNDEIDITIGDPSGSGTGITIREQTAALSGITTSLRMSGAEAINPNEFVTLSQIGSGGSQNLQQITDVGATTTDQITTGGLVSNGNVDVIGTVLADAAQIAGNLVVSGSGNFSTGTLLAATPTAASHAATKAYVDAIFENGEWTPALLDAPAGVSTLPTRGSYYVIGDMVFFEGQLEINSTATGGRIQISGLPFDPQGGGLSFTASGVYDSISQSGVISGNIEMLSTIPRIRTVVEYFNDSSIIIDISGNYRR